MFLNCLAVGFVGFLGAVLRYGIGLFPVKESTLFPAKTFAINLLGCFAIGLITALVAKSRSLGPRLILFIKVGLCGGFTTFSTFALESGDLLRGGHPWIAFAYISASVIFGVLLVFAAQAAVK